FVALEYADRAIHRLVREPMLAQRASSDSDHFLFPVKDLQPLPWYGLSHSQMYRTRANVNRRYLHRVGVSLLVVSGPCCSVWSAVCTSPASSPLNPDRENTSERAVFSSIPDRFKSLKVATLEGSAEPCLEAV